MENTLEKASKWAPGFSDSGGRGPKRLDKIITSQPSGWTEVPKDRPLREDWGMTLVIAEVERVVQAPWHPSGKILVCL